MSRGLLARSRAVRAWSVLLLTVALSALVLAALHGDYQRGTAAAQAAAGEPVDLRIALVNEDRGVLAEGVDVNLGRSYVRQVESDTSARWAVVSRGVAERGLTQGIYDLMVLIPVEFSTTVLDLQVVDPRPVRVSYQVNGGGNPRREAAAAQRGREVVGELNDQLVDMYLASILVNLRQAQEGVRSVVDSEAARVDLLVREVDPAARGMSGELAGLTEDADGARGANDGLLGVLDSLGAATRDGAQGAAAHDGTLVELSDARQAASLTYAEFMAELLAVDARLVGAEVQGLADDLAQIGQGLQTELDARGSANHAAAVAALVTQLDASLAVASARDDALTALDDATVIERYGAAVRQAVDRDGDDRVSLAEAASHPDGAAPAERPELEEVLGSLAAAQIGVLPYRSTAELEAAVARGDLGHAGGAVADGATEIAADLAAVLSWPGADQVPVAPQVVGADLAEVVEALTDALEAVAVPSGPVPDPDPDPGPDPDPDAADALAEAAARYGATVQDIVHAYDAAARLVELAERCATSCGLAPGADVTDAVHAAATTAVAGQVAAERAHLADLAARGAELRATSAAVVAGEQRLRASTQALAANTAGQLASLDALRDSMAQVRDAERASAGAVQGTDAQTQAIAGEARALLARSEALVGSAEAGVQEATRVAEVLEGLRSEVQGVIAGSDALGAGSEELTAALSTQVTESTQFADTFASVLPHAHSAGVLNERLVRFLVDPVDPAPREAVASADVTRPFPWVLTAFCLCFTAASLLVTTAPATGRRGAFVRARTARLRRSGRSLALAAALGAVLGGGLGWASAHALGVARESQVPWLATLVLICAVLTLLAHWLVRQWRTVGVGVALLLLVGYVFVSDAVGSGAVSGIARVLATAGPLSRAEAAMAGLLAGDVALAPVVGPLVAALVVLVPLNLWVREDPGDGSPRGHRAVPA